ncbi:MAG: iron export ABC transporter permease subunit FetB [Gammaproteobacteria bacterium]|jgi:putative ABC transport system permease protein|nr:iron export ABC transporter permease subunit FetB [Gammaproteobacteria bacterium]MBT3490287.1 iron export ABC transporter permease subunit FetB [Gammaproteobacteria bacterium]MBT3719302.1 iron export ABC transporter permease subunit FetB [Gammaproteobacteria bacterium]MBT3845539.1 iron export ABC transporter permease subunit FetB [Gammaproteobacteria bacterium]MBT3893355.1 iron export ABC transporter permease subunit FetB [Gammaproteobacteria bacterium]
MEQNTPSLVILSTTDLMLAALLIVLLALLSRFNQNGLEKRMLFASVRATLQLLLIGVVLQTLFDHINLFWIAMLSLLMILLAGREVEARQQYRIEGGWGFFSGTFAMFLSSMVTTLFGLLVIIQYDPWYHPQYAIPLLGMLLGNTMNGISLGMDRLTSSVWQQRKQIDARLALGERAADAIRVLRNEAIRTGMIPILNAMAAAGLISLPGMMTGQILSGTPPLEAVKYQLLILFLISAGTGFGVMAAIAISSRKFFDERERLRTERISQRNP